MPTLNRFPLLGLWAAESARRVGYSAGDAQALGHAYAVLYAIRAARPRVKKELTDRERAKRQPVVEKVELGGDHFEVRYAPDGKMEALVGHGVPQTAGSYKSAVQAKYPPG